MQQIQVHQYQDLDFEFTVDGYINATKAAANFGKSPKDWLKNKSTQKYISAASEHLQADRRILLTVVKGGDGEQGTFIHPKLAIEFARWLSPKFAVWCDEKIEKILTGRVQSFRPQSQAEMFLQSAQLMVQLEKQVNEMNVKIDRIEKRQESVDLLKSRASAKTPRARLNELVREYAERRRSTHQAVWNKLYQELYYRERVAVKTRAERRGVKPLDVVEEEGLLEAAISIMYMLAEQNEIQIYA